MTGIRTYSAENHGSDNGTRRTRGAERMALEDEARSKWLDEAIRERAVQLKAEKAMSRENGRKGGNAAAGRPKPRTGWVCTNCGARNRLFFVCVECRALKGT